MSTEPPDDDGTHIEADLYYFKFRTTLKPGADEEDPQSWKEVGKQINQHVMRTVRDVFGLVSDFLSAVRRRLRPAAKTAAPDRGEAARRLADEQESKRQQPAVVDCKTDRVLTIEALRDVLNERFLAQGIPIQLYDRSDGTFGITAVLPECQEVAGEIASETQPALKRVSAASSFPVDIGPP